MRFGAPRVALGAVDVRDLARAHIAAGFLPDAEGRHIVSGASDRHPGAWARQLREHFGSSLPLPRNAIPKWLFKVGGARVRGEQALRRGQRRPPVCGGQRQVDTRLGSDLPAAQGLARGHGDADAGARRCRLVTAPGTRPSRESRRQSTSRRLASREHGESTFVSRAKRDPGAVRRSAVLTRRCTLGYGPGRGISGRHVTQGPGHRSRPWNNRHVTTTAPRSSSASTTDLAAALRAAVIRVRSTPHRAVSRSTAPTRPTTAWFPRWWSSRATPTTCIAVARVSRETGTPHHDARRRHLGRRQLDRPRHRARHEPPHEPDPRHRRRRPRPPASSPAWCCRCCRTELAPHGLRFGPDPSTSTRATFGGMIGNNACGPHAVAFGKTCDNVVVARR